MVRSLAAKERAADGEELDSINKEGGTLTLEAVTTAIDNAAYSARNTPVLPPPSPAQVVPKDKLKSAEPNTETSTQKWPLEVTSSTPSHPNVPSRPSSPVSVACSPSSCPPSPSPEDHTHTPVLPPMLEPRRKMLSEWNGSSDSRPGRAANSVGARDLAASASPRASRGEGRWGGGGRGSWRQATLRVASLDLEEELGHVRTASKVPVSEILDDVRQAQRGLGQTKAEVKLALGDRDSLGKATLVTNDGGDGNAAEKREIVAGETRSDTENGAQNGPGTDAGGDELVRFVEEAEARLSAINEQGLECVSTCKKLCEFFGERAEDPNQSGHILMTLVQFLDLLAEAKKAEKVC